MAKIWTWTTRVSTWEPPHSTFGLMYFPDPAAGLRQLHRLLKSGGRVGIATWDMTRTGHPQLIGTALGRRAVALRPSRRQPAGEGRAPRFSSVADWLRWSGIHGRFRHDHFAA